MEYWVRSHGEGAIKRVAEFDGTAPTVELSVELFREVLKQLGFVKQKGNPYPLPPKAPSPGMSHVATTGEGKNPTTHLQQIAAGGASETAAGVVLTPRESAPAAHERTT